MRARVCSALMFVMFVGCKDNSVDEAKMQNQKLMSIISRICDRHGIESISPSITDRTSYYCDGHQFQLRDIIDERQRDRTNGDSSYEEIRMFQARFSTDMALALVRTKLVGSGALSKEEELLNTIVFTRNDDAWQIVHWHASSMK